MTNLFFLAGLPRSGSTLLGTLFNQNPSIYTTQTSSFVEILYRNYSIWSDKNYAEDFVGSKMKDMKIPYLQKITDAYYEQLTNNPLLLTKEDIGM